MACQAQADAGMTAILAAGSWQMLPIPAFASVGQGMSSCLTRRSGHHPGTTLFAALIHSLLDCGSIQACCILPVGQCFVCLAS